MHHDHHESNKSDTKFHNNAVEKYSQALSEFLDNSTLDFTNVFNIMTHSVLEHDTELINFEDIGEALLTEFINTRKNGAGASVWDKISRRNLGTFRNSTKCISIKFKDKIVSLREERGLMTRLLVLAKSRPGINLSELFKKHEFSVTPRSFFSPGGLPWKCQDKSAFLTGLEGFLSGVALDLNATTKNLVSIDCMGIVNQLKIHDGVETLTDLADQFVNRLEHECQLFDIVVLAFDRYNTSKPSLKQQTWDDRNKGKRVQYNLTPKTVIKNTKLKELLSHPVNKQRMCDLFAKRSTEMLRNNGKDFVVGFGSSIISNIVSWTHKKHDHEEADTLIICIIREVVKVLKKTLKIKIVSPDADVLVLAIRLVAEVSNVNMLFELLCSKSKRLLDVNFLVNYLGQSKSLGLVCAYVYTGCDQIGKFNSISKARALNTYLDCPAHLIDDLQNLGDSFDGISDNTTKALHQYTMLLYTKKKEDRDVISKFNDIGDLRWHRFSKHQQETHTLPPTPDALKFHIQRANYICATWKLSIRKFSPVLCDAKERGWELKDGKLFPIMTDQLPAPKYSIEMNSCSCKKTNCLGGNCSYAKHGLRCTDLCKCSGCENEELRFAEIDNEESDQDEDCDDE